MRGLDHNNPDRLVTTLRDYIKYMKYFRYLHHVMYLVCLTYLKGTA